MDHFESVKSMIDHLRSDDPELRLNSMRGIHLIASTLGPERTRDELLPYLTDFLDENDEVLRVYANALGTMLHEVGGTAYAWSLLNPLGILCSLDEITVREEAVASLQHIADKIFGDTGGGGSNDISAASPTAARKEFISLVQQLGTNTPQCRSAASSLIASVYPYVSGAVKSSLMAIFQDLCSDEEIMVRRAACIAIGKKFAQVLGPKSSDLTGALSTFSKDSCDGVRLQAVPTAASMLKILSVTQHSSVVLAVKALASDASWRVRYMTADYLSRLAEGMSPPDVVKYAVPMFRSLCQDAEPEIRSAAVFSMPSILAACSEPSCKKDVLVTGARLISDDSSHVRMSLASAVLKSVPHVPKPLWASTIVSGCMTLLQDSDADVRLALVSGFSSMGNIPEARELAPKLIPVIVSLACDPKWRIREVVVSQVPYIIISLGRSAEDVLHVCVERITDRVATIRDAAVQSCGRLVSENGAAWAVQTLFPRLQELASDSNYLYRVALCHFYASLAYVTAFDSGSCRVAVWPTLVQLSDDPVPNVRINVAKAILSLKGENKISAKDADPVLSRLSRDTDVDVRDAVKARGVKH